MKVRQQRVDRAKLVGGPDEQIGVAHKRLQLAVGGSRLQEPNRGGAHGHNPPAPAAAGMDPLDRRLAHAPPFGMHPVFGQRFSRDRPERAGAHVQCQRAKVDPLLCQPIEQCCGEVQAGRRRRHRAGHLGVNRLVVFAIGFDHLALADVRGQRHAAHAFQQHNGIFHGQRPGDPRAIRLAHAQL